jgi:ubiquitin-conjugating enzyme E2 M
MYTSSITSAVLAQNIPHVGYPLYLSLFLSLLTDDRKQASRGDRRNRFHRMLRAKKKKEEEAAAAAAAAAKIDVDGGSSSSFSVEAGEMEKPHDGGAPATENGTVSIMGIGGKSVKAAQSKGRRRQPAELRIQKDLAEVELGTAATLIFPNPNDLTDFIVEVSPESGFWTGAKFTFTFRFPAEYPHTPPKVTCQTRILHPNIDWEGNVCLNILREEWKPILDVNAIIYGLLHLFAEPNPDDPLNKEAAELFRADARQFERVVKQTLRGLSYQGHTFERLL